MESSCGQKLHQGNLSGAELQLCPSVIACQKLYNLAPSPQKERIHLSQWEVSVLYISNTDEADLT